MLVKCQLCGEKIERDTAYKVVNGKTNKYYCSADEYTSWQTAKAKEKLHKDKVFTLIGEILGFPITPSLLVKEWKEWNMLATDEVIGGYLEENKDYLAGCISRLSGNPFGKMRYLSKTIQGGLLRWKPKQVEQPKPKVVVEEVMYEAPTRTLNRRRSLADLEEEI